MPGDPSLPIISYNSFLRRSAGSRLRAATNENRRRYSEATNAVDDGNTIPNQSSKSTFTSALMREPSIFTSLISESSNVEASATGADTKPTFRTSHRLKGAHTSDSQSHIERFLEALDLDQQNDGNSGVGSSPDDLAGRNPDIQLPVFRKEIRRKKALAPLHFVSFHDDPEVRAHLAALFHDEGIGADGMSNIQDVSNILERLSKRTLSLERKELVASRPSTQLQKSRGGTDKKTDHIVSKNVVVNRPTLIERFQRSQDKDPELGCDGTMSPEDDLTAKTVLLRKLEILRRDRGLRRLFFEEVASVREDSFQQSLLMRQTSIIERNKSLVDSYRPIAAHQHRRQHSAAHDRRLDEARLRYNDVQGRRRDRFVALVERARGIGYDYDTGLTPLTSPYTYGSAENDCAAFWIKVIALIRSRRVLLSSASAIVEGRSLREAVDRRHHREARCISLMQRWWRRIAAISRIRRTKASSEMISDFLKRLPRVQVRFRLAMRGLIGRVVKIQRHVRAVAEARRRRVSHGLKILCTVISTEIERLEKSIVTLVKERKKIEGQMNAAVKARKPHFQSQLKVLAEQLMDKGKCTEYLLALSDDSKLLLVDGILSQKARLRRAKVLEYATNLNRKFLALNAPGRLVELVTGVRTMGTLLSSKEQEIVHRTATMFVAAPYASMNMSPADAIGIVEERGYALGEADAMNANLNSSRPPLPQFLPIQSSVTPRSDSSR